MPSHPFAPRRSPGARRAARLVVMLGLLLAALGPAAGSVAASGLTMEARVLLAGHARVGSWVAISVHLKNDGPAVNGELRLAGGTQGQTRFGTVVDLPTQSDQVYLLYAQPPSFGNELSVVLVEGETTVSTAKATFTIHDATQLVVAVVAEHPEHIVGSLDLLPNQNQVAPLVVGLTPEDLPERVEAWSAIDRLVWQDVDSERLSNPQRDALRGWIAGGGRLVIAGGTVGPKALSAFPDGLLPYRPVVTTDVPAASLSGLLGQIPAIATTLPALSGELIEGRALASVGGQVVAAERAYGSGSVTLIGFDPGVDWIAKTDTAGSLWRRLLPARSSGGLSFVDDNMLVGAVLQLPTLALPPITGLLVMFLAYILLIGPINYLILRRLDRREWAWITMPILIVVFAVGAYGYGAALRGSDVIVNEIAIVRGAPGATEGSAQVYLGIFSPSRSVYQVSVPGGALLSSTINGDAFGGTSVANALDVLQGDPARIRNLSVGFGALRTVRAETPVAVPLVETDLRLEDGHLRGTVKNASAQLLERPAVVLGQTVALLGDLKPGDVAKVDVAIQSGQNGQSLADKVAGPNFGTDTSVTPEMARTYVRHNMVDQLTFDPNFGSTNRLAADGPVVLAWDSNDLLPVEIAGQQPKHLGNVLYYLPARLAIHGRTTFRSDLIGSTIVATDAVMFNKDPQSLSFGLGSATVAYRPMGFEGTIAATELAIGLNFGDPGSAGAPVPVKPLTSIPPACATPPTKDCQATVVDGVAEVELFDLRSGTWQRLPRFQTGTRYVVDQPARYVDPASGTVLVRFVNDRSEGVGFTVDVSITGEIQ
ncbi:MAG: hypothetical protein ABJC39_06350 [Chloroflexota bacterium]